VADRALAHYAELLRSDFSGFAHRAHLELYPAKRYESNWHIDVLADKLDAVRKGKINRLIINVPPRTMKSFLGSIAFPAFLLGHNPSAEVLCISYGEKIAGTFALPCRNLMVSPSYQALFRTRLADDKQAVDDFATTAGGSRRAVSWGGAITGQGADFLIIDDPLKAEEGTAEGARSRVNEGYIATVSGRVNRDSCAIILIMQRLHINDLSGFVQKNGGEDWDVVALPALAEHDEIYTLGTPFGRRIIRRPKGRALQPQRVSEQSLINRRKLNARIFDAQYQQKPHGSENAVIKREWLAYYDENTKPTQFDTILQSWDTGNKPGEGNSYSVCTTWGVKGNRFYLLDVVRDQLDYRKLKPVAISLASSEPIPHRILIEEQSTGYSLASDLGDMGFPVESVPTGSASKTERLYIHVHRFESGQVLLPRVKEQWLDTYIEELTTFPDSDYSDQVDSTSQALSADVSGSSARNAIRAMQLLSDNPTVFDDDRKRVKLMVKIGGGVYQFQDGSGRPPIQIPEAGKTLKVPEDVAAILTRDWKKFDRIPD
jgi:predicted phage terminase large subunit-like protein